MIEPSNYNSFMDHSPHPRVLTRGFSFLALFLLGIGCSRVAQPPDPHIIGHVAPRSGPDQAAGLRSAEAVALAVGDINVNEALRIDGRPVSVVHGDTGPDLDGFAHQGTRLLAVNRVTALIGATNAAELEKLIPAIQAHQIVLVSPSGGTADNASRLAFYVGIDPKERGRILGKFAAEERMWTDVAVVTDANNPIFPVMAAAFLQEYRTVDRKVRGETNVRSRNEWPDLAARLAKAKPQAVLFAGSARDLLAFRAGLQKAESAAEIPILFVGEEEEAVLLRDTEAARGVFWTTAFTETDSAKSVQEFCKQIRTRSQQTPDVAAALSYDAARILFAAARKAKMFRVKELRDDGLKPWSETDGLTGPFWFTPEQTARRTVYVMQLADGKPKVVKAYPPAK